MFTVDKDINAALSDTWTQYRTLRFNGLVRGQLIAQFADATVRALNAALVSQDVAPANFLAQ